MIKKYLKSLIELIACEMSPQSYKCVTQSHLDMNYASLITYLISCRPDDCGYEET